jgi:hypothetical protein
LNRELELSGYGSPKTLSGKHPGRPSLLPFASDETWFGNGSIAAEGSLS